MHSKSHGFFNYRGADGQLFHTEAHPSDLNEEPKVYRATRKISLGSRISGLAWQRVDNPVPGGGGRDVVAISDCGGSFALLCSTRMLTDVGCGLWHMPVSDGPSFSLLSDFYERACRSIRRRGSSRP